MHEQEENAAGKRILMAFVAAFFVCAAVYVWSRAWRAHRLAHADVATTCTVLHRDLDVARDSKDHETYAVRLRVAWEVDDKRYEGTDVGDYVKSSSAAANELQRYQVGGTVPCWTTKGAPEVASVFPKAASEWITSLVMGFVFLLIPVAGIAFPGKRGRRRRGG